ncbi:MAG TPA: membrane dipeptidase [Thermoanaerobaculia bacterium]|jgi:membrane dipeptidase|nr:membrane dipeptidase [Thermoanaerobaculia bacterium]
MLSRRRFLLGCALATGGGIPARRGLAVALAEARSGAAIAIGADDPRVLGLVERATVIDMLGLLTLDWGRLRSWQRNPTAFGDADFKRLLASGVDVFHPAVDPNSSNPHAAALGWAADWNELLQNQARYLLAVRGVADLDRARAEKRIGILIGFQSSEHFRTVEDVALFYGLGQRVSQLTYNDRCRLGSGCRDPRDQGLTDFGRRIVAEMNRVGMAIDVSHCSEKTTLDAIARSDRPVLVTHANCQALAHHPRNKSDAVIRALARRGGVMGIATVRAFLGGEPTIEGLLDHFVHVAQLVGVEHVGIGSDCDLDLSDPATGRARMAYDIRGLRNTRRAYDLAAGLLSRGFGDAEVQLVLGGNFRRALGQIWTE